MSSDDEAAVRSASDRFYRAFETLSIEAMSRVWLHDDKVSCVHPVWPFSVGWPAVRQSWERIFETMKNVRFDVSVELVDVRGDFAWMVCVERITGSHAGTVLATNLFRRDGSTWHMVLHHASTHVRAAGG